MIDRDWPSRRRAFERWLSPGNFDAEGRQRLSLLALNESVLARGDLRPADIADLQGLAALQQAAYAPNAAILGVEPLPLRADYGAILGQYEVWLADDRNGPQAALILDPHPDHLLVWSIATAPEAQGRGLGRRLLAAAEERARQLGLSSLRLYTGEKLQQNIRWYSRHGYEVDTIEPLTDRLVVHMRKTIQ
jgi:ribosomal protein S18 acetylase RimI-like enzyme